MAPELQKILKQLPAEPGVYLFFDDARNLLYVGKAAILRHRVKQYFQKGYAKHNPAKQTMINEIADVQWEITNSEIGALVKESELIKEKKPKYNITLRDDKNYFWVIFSNDKLPRIHLTHQPFNFGAKKSATPNTRYKALGPFTDGRAIKKTLRILRSIFPYCTCKNNHHKACLNVQMNRCPGICCITKKDSPKDAEIYLNNIRSIRRVLMGKSKKLLNDLRKQMNEAKNAEQFEKASELRDQTNALKTTLNHAHILGSPTVSRPRKNESALIELKKALNLSTLPIRIEAYDVANIQSDAPTASMVVATNGTINPAEYRQFHIKGNAPNDIASLAEALQRRLNHNEWPLPDLILMDGGKGQLNVALRTLDATTLSSRPAIIALAKKDNELYRENVNNPILLREINADAAYLLQQLRDEAHRFARKLHHKKRSEYLK